MIGRGLDGSAVKYLTAVSGVNLSVGGSTGPSDLGEFETATVIFACESADGTVKVERSATSDGTFGLFGCSVPGTASGTSIRSFATGTSARWHRLQYSNEDAGSMIVSVTLVGQGARFVPISTQDTQTNVYSFVAAAR
jgi:hypothetical protein